MGITSADYQKNIVTNDLQVTLFTGHKITNTHHLSVYKHIRTARKQHPLSKVARCTKQRFQDFITKLKEHQTFYAYFLPFRNTQIRVYRKSQSFIIRHAMTFYRELLRTIKYSFNPHISTIRSIFQYPGMKSYRGFKYRETPKFFHRYRRKYSSKNLFGFRRRFLKFRLRFKNKRNRSTAKKIVKLNPYKPNYKFIIRNILRKYFRKKPFKKPNIKKMRYTIFSAKYKRKKKRYLKKGKNKINKRKHSKIKKNFRIKSKKIRKFKIIKKRKPVIRIETMRKRNKRILNRHKVIKFVLKNRAKRFRKRKYKKSFYGFKLKKIMYKCANRAYNPKKRKLNLRLYYKLLKKRFPSIKRYRSVIPTNNLLPLIQMVTNIEYIKKYPNRYA